MENLQITLELAVEEINTILASLGKHPFESIDALIQKIQSQGTAQISEFQATQTEEVPEDTESDAG